MILMRMMMNKQSHSSITRGDNYCPACLRHTDMATGGGDRKPIENDISVCAYCGAVCKFDHDMKLVDLPDGELNEIKIVHPDLFEEILENKRIVKNLPHNKPKDIN